MQITAIDYIPACHVDENFLYVICTNVLSELHNH
jgi:hypothetical protein